MNTQLKREEKAKKEKIRIAKIKGFLDKHGAENVTTNGYVYDFDYKGMSGHFRDQTDRIVGDIHRPFISSDDRRRYHDKKLYVNAGGLSSLVSEYAYESFLIYGQPWEALCEVFRLIENVIIVRWLG